MVTSRSSKRYGLLVAGILLLSVGVIGIYLGDHNFPIRALGLLAVILATYPITASRRQPNEAGGVVTVKTSKGPGPFLWLISIALVPVFGAALFLMHIDAANGGHEAWPADVFFWVALVCCVVWALLTTKILARGR